MTQKINFYTEILRVRNIPMSFHVIKNFIYGLVIFMTISTILFGIIAIKNERDLKELEKQQLATFTKLQSQESKVTPKVDRDKIVAQLEINEKLYEKNKKVLNELDQLLKYRTEGFSKYLISLSKSVPKGLWLTKIELLDTGNHFSLYGKALEANLITTFISALNKEQSFTGKILNTFDVSYNKKDSVLEFKIQTGTENPP